MNTEYYYETDKDGAKARGIHGGKPYQRDPADNAMPDKKAQSKLAQRLLAHKMNPPTHKRHPLMQPGSLNRRNH